MSQKSVTLESLAEDGRHLLSISHPSDAHHAFTRWCDIVAKWVDERFPDSGLSADWSGQPMSILVVGNHYDSSGSARVHFNQVVAVRLKWLGALGKSACEQTDVRDSRTQESDSLFAEITQLVTATLLPQQFKAIVCLDIAEAHRSYRAAAYKGCVVMLGAALEGIMLGTLLRPDVIAHLST